MLMELVRALAALGGLGALTGAVLALSDRLLRVEEDPRLHRLTAALPGIDCKACGFRTCAAYAAGVLEGTTVIGACPVGGSRSAARMARIRKVPAPAPQARQVALVQCAGPAEPAAAGEDAGQCRGECVSACRFDAIHLTGGAASVEAEKCRGCLLCVAACPQGRITVVPWSGDSEEQEALEDLEGLEELEELESPAPLEELEEPEQK